MPVSGVNYDTSVQWLRGNGTNTDSSLLDNPGSLSLSDDRPISEQIGALLKKFSLSTIVVLDEDGNPSKSKSIVASILDATGIPIEKTEMKVRELLKDHHSTFSLFESSVKEISKPANIGTSCSINLYIQDISNPKFIGTLKKAIKNGLDPKLINLEIYPDNYGVADQIVTNNLREVVSLGFGFSMILDEESMACGEEGTNFEKIIDDSLTPIYVKLTRSILYKIRTDSLKISKKLKTLLAEFEVKGSLQYIKTSKQGEVVNNEVKKPFLLFLAKSTIQEEDILSLNGERHAQEYLIRFGEGVSVFQGLERLKILDMTDDLMNRMISPAVDQVVQGGRVSINLYLKNLGSSNFCKEIMAATKSIPKEKRKYLIFEILEEKYGYISPLLISNIRFLQKQGFAIAIDDLYLGDNPRGISKGILETFIVENIVPDYIKIDGRHMAEIQDLQRLEEEIKQLQESLNAPKGEIEQRMAKRGLLVQRISHLKEIIGHFSVGKKGTTFILEWIQNTEHAILAHNTLCYYNKESGNKSTFLYQGMHIHAREFGTPLEENELGLIDNPLG